MFIKKIFLINTAILLFVQAYLSGCPQSRDANNTNTKADFAGFITNIRPKKSDEGNSTIFAESHANKLVHRCVIEVTSATIISRWDGRKYLTIRFEEIVLKDKIQAWFFHKATEPYPEKGTAQKVVVSHVAFPPKTD